MKKVFIIRGPEQVEHLLRFVENNWPAMSKSGEPMQVMCTPYRGMRTNDQLAALWAGILQPMAEQAWVGGKQYSAEVWHEHAKRTILPAMLSESDAWFKHTEMWVVLPNGDRTFKGSTDMLNKKGMNEYMGRLEEMAIDLGVRLPTKDFT